MTSPVSIGDAVLMANLALKLGRAFTKGRKSAPAEFREVENQLYSLSAALSALDRAHKTAGSALNIDQTRLPSLSQQRQADGEDVLKSMLRSCEETLKHLEIIVEKYGSIGKPKDPEAPVLKRWSRELRNNWKKVAWTTEGGDLATLRSQFTVHTNCLNLVLGVINHTQTDRLEDRVGQVAAMLKEIHTWFVDNLRDRMAGTSRVQSYDVAPVVETSLIGIRFELLAELPDGAKLLCNNASLHPKWNEKHSGSEVSESATQKQVFQCQCPDQTGGSAPHSVVLEALGLSPLSFALRIAGKQRTWMLYKVADRATNKLVSLVIKHVPASRIAEFEELFIESLGSSQVKSMLRRNMSTMLVYTTTAEADGSSAVHILNLIGDLQGVHKQIRNVTFMINGQSYTRSSIETVQLLHYKTRTKEHLLSDSVVFTDDLVPMRTAEVVIFYASSEMDIDRTILQLTHKTRIRCLAGAFNVLLQSIDCTGLGSDDQATVMRGVDVSFQLATPEAAMEFRTKLEDMRMELYVMSLKAPCSDERLVLKLQAKGVHTEEVDIADSEISIAQSEKSGRFRLIIVSKDGSTILSQELANDFLSGPSDRPNFGSATYVVQIIGSGTRKIHLYDKGFQFVDFSDVQMDRLFGLGLAAVSGSSTLPGLLSSRVGSAEN